MDRAKQYELFGSDSEEEGEDLASHVAVLGSATVADTESAAAADYDDVDGNLFGSDDDDEDDAGITAPAANSAAPVHYSLPTLPRPAADAKLFLVRVPNILQLQPRPFDPDTFEEEDLGDGEEVSKVRAENVIRWRESRDSGERQSNARVVTWSDGSMTLHVGSEVLLAQAVAIPEGSTHLYTRHTGSNLECHGVLKQRIALAPASRDSKTHKVLTQKIARCDYTCRLNPPPLPSVCAPPCFNTLRHCTLSESIRSRRQPRAPLCSSLTGMSYH